tara:strand:- start:812 stop:1783 length:972 start_codon:yes stop_codon:yes gene_type:complete
MVCNEYYEILQLERNKDYNKLDLRKHYFKLALKYHPDKYGDNGDKFKELKMAYDTINDQFKYKSSVNYNFLHENETRDYKSTSSHNQYKYENIETYNEILEMILKFVSSNIKTKEKFSNLIFFNTTINTIIHNCNDVSLKIFEKISKEKCIDIYEFLLCYNDFFGISNDFFLKLKEVIQKKVENDNILIVTPTLNDILEDKVFKMDFMEKELYIPLWHHELHFDISNTNIIVQCIPDISKNIFIDNKNNIHCRIEKNISDVLNEPKFIVKLASKTYEIKKEMLKITKEEQTYKIRHDGILLIKDDDIYNTENRGDVIFLIHLK